MINRMDRPAGPSERERQQALAEQVLRAESDAIGRLVIDGAFHQAVDLLLACTGEARHGSVVVSGLGKSGLIGRKLSATFASTGTPSHFLHPTEAMHGDLGRIRRDDIVLLLSYGGSTEEILALAGVLKQDQVPVVAMAGSPDSALSRLASVTLSIGEQPEACPLNLAPTASTTAMLALGDALALCLMERRQFGVADFRRNHPGGGLGRQLMPVVEAMRFRAGENLPLINGDLTIEQAYLACARIESRSGLRRAGAVLVVDATGALAGIFTDGDLRRCLLQHGSGAYHERIDRFMTHDPTTLADTALVRDAVQLVREHRFDELPVVDARHHPVGLIDVQDLVSLKVIAG